MKRAAAGESKERATRDDGLASGETDPVPRPYRLDEQVGYLLRMASQRHAVIFQERAALGLTPTQFAALMRIHEIGQCSQNHLGRLTAMDVATIKGVVARLHEKGLVELTRDPSDKRRTLITLSAAARSHIPALHAFGREVSAATLERLSEAEQRVFLHLLNRLV